MNLLLLLFHLAYAGLLLVFSFGFYMAGRRFRAGNPSKMPSATVLVPFRNEQANLPGLLSDLLKQDYPRDLLEIIFIDDHSSDHGAELVASYGKQVKIIRLPDTSMGKKAALEAGVAASSSEWILTTDADCRLPKGWVSSLIRVGHASGACMVCGTVDIAWQSVSPLSVLQVLETHLLQRMGAASLSLGFPLLNTGASLAFRRDAFIEVGGYSANRHLASGDDTFLLLAMHSAHPGRVVPCILPESRVTTAAEPDWGAYLAQRHRRASKVGHYRSPSILLLGAFLFLAQCTTWIALVQFILGILSFPMLTLFLALRFLPEILLLGSRLPLRHLLAAVPVSLVFPLLNMVSILPLGASGQTWKGRPLVNKKH
ncbi:MAG: hypothetical protein RLZZ630_1628 [Bacteroidota bacterium]|jgi:cellulose synthase/poly-beta-1,6-N-acetylglucosamine synthase-like glycosyltransferase